MYGWRGDTQGAADPQRHAGPARLPAAAAREGLLAAGRRHRPRRADPHDAGWAATYRVAPCVGGRAHERAGAAGASRTTAAGGAAFVSGARVYPVGAEMVSANEAHVRVWAPGPRAGHPDHRQPHRRRSMPRPAATSAARSSPSRARATASASRATTRSIPTRPRARSRTARTACRPSSTCRPMRGTTTTGPASSLPGQVLYEFHVGTFTTAGTWRAAADAAAASARRRHHRDADDAGGGVRRRLRLGLRRRAVVRAVSRLRHAGRSAALRRHRAWARPGGDARRRLQPPRPVRQLPAPLLAVVRQLGATPTNGATRSTSTTRHCEGHARAGAVERRLLGARVPPRRLPHRRRPADLRRLARTRPGGADAGGPRDGRAARDHRRRRARAAARQADAAAATSRRLRHGRRLQRGLPPLDAGRADRRARGLHVGLPRHRPRVAVGGAARLPLPGPVLSRGSRARRGAPALDRPAHEFIAFIENHDQVANAAVGQRLVDIASPPAWRAMSALLLLGPWTPLLFQGQEWGTRTPFRYFCDHAPGPAGSGVPGPPGSSSASSPACAMPTMARPSRRSVARRSTPAGSTTPSIRWPIRTGGCIGI